MELNATHITLLRRGERGQWIGLSDNMGFRMPEVAALGELKRAGFVEEARGPFPPGPAAPLPCVITEAGRHALHKMIGRPVPHHGSGPDNQ